MLNLNFQFKRTKLLPLFICMLLILALPAPAKASLFDDFLKEMQDTLRNKADELNLLPNRVEDKNPKNKELRIDTNIVVIPSGDKNKNGEIDSGDLVRFSFTLTNTTDKSYSYATLKTNIDKKQLNFIHSLKGATGLSIEKDLIVFNNIRLGVGEQRIISFDARVNYSTDDKLITSEPEFISSDNKSIVKSSKKEINVKKLTKEELKEQIKNKVQVLRAREEKK